MQWSLPFVQRVVNEKSFVFSVSGDECFLPRANSTIRGNDFNLSAESDVKTTSYFPFDSTSVSFSSD